MASLIFEGDLSGLVERQLQFIREVIEKEGFTNNKVLFEPVGKAGDNYVASVKRIIIVVNGKDDIKIIVKIAPQHENMRTVMNTGLLFSNEVIMYEKVLPKFTSLEASVNVPENARFKYPKCYGCLLEVPYELIMLEDLSNKDYIMLDRMLSLEEDAVKSTLKNFALLHSLSFALKNFEPETFGSYEESLFDFTQFIHEAKDFRKTYTIIVENAVAVVDNDYKETVREISSQWFTLYENAHKTANPAHSIIQHGDAWTNNILFKVKDGKIIDSIMIDYQVSKTANPAYDILFMIFICTDHISRSKHYHEWMSFYHEELDRSLSNFGLKADLVYPKSQLDADLKKHSKFFFGYALFMTSMTLRSEEEAALAKECIKDGETADDNMNISTLSENTMNLMRSKLECLVDSCREFGYIEN